MTAVALLSSAAAANAQDQQQAHQSPAQSQPASLDDLLGISGDKPATTAPSGDAAAEGTERDLEKKLNEEDVTEAFVQAVDRMEFCADLLENRQDAGLGTQRTQEEILAKLQILLDQARKNRNNPSSASSSSQQQQSQPKQNQRNPGKQNRQQNQGNQRNNQPAGSTEAESPDPLQPDPNADSALEETRTQWGSLPPRVRDMLLQGSREKFSGLYDMLTREYYRRLAEEGTP